MYFYYLEGKMNRHKKTLIVIILAIVALVFSGCNGGGVVPGTTSDQEQESEEIRFIIDTNPSSDLICMAGIKDDDSLMVLGKKDTKGNILDVDGTAFINELGEGIVIEIDDNGYPTRYIDSDGNKITYENYTQTTVDVSVYDSEDELVEGPTTVNFDPNLLTELIQHYNSVKGTRTVSNLARDGAELIHFIADTIPIGWVLIEAAACGLSFSIPPLAEAVCSVFLLDLVSLIIEEGDPDKIDKLTLLLDTAEIGIGIIDTGEGYTASFFGVQGNAVNFVADLLDYSAVIDDILDEHIKFINAVEGWDWQLALFYCKTNSEAYNQVLKTEIAFDKTGFNSDNTNLFIFDYALWGDVSIKNRPIATMDHSGKFVLIKAEEIVEIELPYISVSSEFLEVYDNKWRLTKSGILDSLLYELEQVTNETNHAPVISNLTANPSSIDVTRTTTITCSASDQDVGDILTYNWTKTGGTITGSGSTVTWTAPSTTGTYTITCSVSDGKGGQDSDSISIVVTESDEEDVSTNDYVKILSVTPDSGLIDGVWTDFVIEAEYRLDSFEKGTLWVQFNLGEYFNCPCLPWNCFSIDGIIGDTVIHVNRGTGSHIFNVSLRPKDWGDLGDFRLLVDLDEFPIVEEYSLAYEFRVLSFK
jgi:hypothetical protein